MCCVASLMRLGPYTICGQQQDKVHLTLLHHTMWHRYLGYSDEQGSLSEPQQ